MADESTDAQVVEAVGLIDDFTPATPPVEVSIWWYVGPLIVAFVLVVVLWLMRGKIQAKYAKMTVPAPPDPAKNAREELAELRASMEGMAMREFIDRLSKIFRRYLEGHYKVRVTSQTTGEFLRAVAGNEDFEQLTRDKTQEFLETSDAAKFAHRTVPISTGTAFLDWVENFIKAVEVKPKKGAAK
ncbi:hypothetical protein [Cerasicoccus maritimus]|uniref:hypothetical protein n=1 Tax=Cerasicoccus maritimus TaxID=490089 RepID=UPI002852970E|nr:hypothetical protein [Cerasicoccus maritimus]